MLAKKQNKNKENRTAAIEAFSSSPVYRCNLPVLDFHG